jgi:hypothetical protein
MYGRLACLFGFVRKGEVQSAFTYFSCDVGAVLIAPLDDPHSDYHQMVYLLGQGHEMFLYGRIVMKLIFHMGGAALAVLHTFVTKCAQDYMKRCGSNKKANDFILDVYRPAVIQHLSCVFLATNPSDSSKEAFMAWIDSDDNDAHFKSCRTLFVDVFSAYNLVYVGIRERNLEVYDAGRRYLLPFVFCMGGLDFGPILLRDLVIYEHQILSEVNVTLLYPPC